MGWAEWFYFFIIIQIIHGLGTWKLYKSANFNPALSFIPIYNGIILLKIINKPWWWLILLFIPIVNLLIFPVIWVGTIKSFGKKSLLDIFLVVLTLGFYIYTINITYTLYIATPIS